MSYQNYDIVNAMRSELQLWIKLANGTNEALKTAINNKTTTLNKAFSYEKNSVGLENTADKIREWWKDPQTKIEISKFLDTPREIDGLPHNWRVNIYSDDTTTTTTSTTTITTFVGVERCCDVIINRRLTRIYFTSRKFKRYALSEDIPDGRDYLFEFMPDQNELTDTEIKAHKKKKLCAGCGVFGKTMKTECCGERYCGMECWRGDWVEHRKKCDVANCHHLSWKSRQEID
jgi:hypothetical protein